ncbi:MAG TPA: beta-propeller fold lactonase family protein [Candidatus Saccharimonadales bacterium]|nr:beta-propeller fold lactonase family protein [Candidatus Saccharimonadales bacterium]
MHKVAVSALLARLLGCDLLLTLVFLGLSVRCPAAITMTNFFNWETAPVHPVALSPDGTRLAVCNLPDDRLELFDVSSNVPVSLGSVMVGLDPVSVRFRTATELWVANAISGSISVVDLPTLRAFTTLATSNQPSDIIFAGSPSLAYVSCGQPNLVQVFNPANLQWTTNLAIDGNRPRAMAASPDGSKVYVAIFESGNASTVVGSGISPLDNLPRPEPVTFPNAPSQGLDPPPNQGTNFMPPINPLTLSNAPPRAGLIVKKNGAGRWMDDNQGDWTEFIRGANAALTGRLPGWDLPDHDVAIINTTNFAVGYATGLMNICMAVAVNPVSGQIAVAGTDALNQIRFQPVLDGIFVRVNLALVDPSSLTNNIVDLNPHLTYAAPQTTAAQQALSIGDPRDMVWSADGSRGYVTGMGSDNLVILDTQGNRLGQINTGSGPAGVALNDSRGLLYVYNRFDSSISVVDTAQQSVTATIPLFNPTPAIITAGRPFLYNTHLTSGLGQASCASCHVDGRVDRLAWDLGDPTDVMNVIDSTYNVIAPLPVITNNFHPMKGPMTTLTLQDIIGHEPFHWRGDREGIEQFNLTFTNLQGMAEGLNATEMQEFKSFLGTIGFAPNPFRQFDNSLSTNLALPGQFATGRGALPGGAPLGHGNAQAGLAAFLDETGDACIVCHTLPTGLGTDMRFTINHWVQLPLSANNSHHAALVQIPRSSNLPFKIPQLRNLFDKMGMDLGQTNSRSGFGLMHDGSVDSLPRFLQDSFGITDDQETADMVAFLFSFSGSGLPAGSLTDPNDSPGLRSLDTPAGAGAQITINNPAEVPLIDSMISLAGATSNRVDLVVKGFESGLPRGWLLSPASGLFQSDRSSETETPDALRALAAVGSEQTYTLVTAGSGERIGIDRDADGYFDRDELDYGFDPANPLSLPTNTPPRLGGVGNVAALKGLLLAEMFTATDSDIPAQSLTFSLGGNSPFGAAINPTNGLFTWIPSGPPGPITNSITVIVTDNGMPPLSASATFRVIAQDVSLSSLKVKTNSTTLTWNSVPGFAYQLQYKNELTDTNWINLGPSTHSIGNSISQTDTNLSANGARFYRIVATP